VSCATRVVGPEEYDAAVMCSPDRCPLFAAGDLRSGRQVRPRARTHEIAGPARQQHVQQPQRASRPGPPGRTVCWPAAGAHLLEDQETVRKEGGEESRGGEGGKVRAA
jgi:hypothetical protein